MLGVRMGSLRDRIDKVREAPSIGGALRLVYRKLIFRRVTFLRYEVSAGRSRDPGVPEGFRIEFISGPDYGTVEESSPYLSPEDLENFREQNATCIVALDGPRVAASTWMMSGAVEVADLDRTLDVPPTEHYSCRSYVAPEYRGKSLMSSMIHSYSASVPDSHLVWGLVYEWNTASIRMLEKIGWQLTGTYSTTWVLGRRFIRDWLTDNPTGSS
jgi:RimJ/RimL family protein N-acetyltransferase